MFLFFWKGVGILTDIPPQTDLPAETENRKPAKKKKKRTAKSYALSLLAKIGATVLLMWILLNYVVGVYICHDNYTYPMIKDGDLCVTYRLDQLRQGDEIVYLHEGQVRFGRIAAQAGDSVDIDGESITVNGYLLTEDTVYPTTREGASLTFPYKVPGDCVFVLNDHRDDPDDSRIYGGIPLSDVQGKVILLMRRRGI